MEQMEQSYVMNSPEGLSMIWLIPGFPILATILLTLWPTHQRRGAAWIGIGAMALSLLGASIAFLAIAGAPGEEGLVRWVHNFLWFDVGESPIKIGWLLDPLSAVMLWMVTFVSLLVLIYSSGYMANDQRMVPILCLPVPFRRSHVGAPYFQPPSRIVHVLGSRWVGVLPPDWLLVPQTFCSSRMPKGFHHHAHWGSRTPVGAPVALSRHGMRLFYDGVKGAWKIVPSSG